METASVNTSIMGKKRDVEYSTIEQANAEEQ